MYIYWEGKRWAVCEQNTKKNLVPSLKGNLRPNQDLMLRRHAGPPNEGNKIHGLFLHLGYLRRRHIIHPKEVKHHQCQKFPIWSLTVMLAIEQNLQIQIQFHEKTAPQNRPNTCTTMMQGWTHSTTSDFDWLIDWYYWSIHLSYLIIFYMFESS